MFKKLMEINESELQSFIKTIEILKPYLSDVVVVGGWVPFLYRKYGNVPARHPSLRTMDIDMAVPKTLNKGDRPTIDELLLKAGYKASLYGSARAVVKYELQAEGIEIEFLTPEIGKPGNPIISVQQGLNAQALRYLQILIENTIIITIRYDLDGIKTGVDLRIPSLGTFVYQKGLTLRLRKEKVAKDLYYIFDIIDSSSEIRNSILSEINDLREQYQRQWFKTFIKNLAIYFPETKAAGPRLIATQYNGTMNEDIFINYVHHTFLDFISDLSVVK
jgi:hypothetical protein